MYRIKRPEGRHLRIILDRKLKDRGQTRWHGNTITVVVGPTAFSSWSVLGSTLAHEIEVHAHQNIRMIRLGEAFGLPAIRWAETNAYRYEINNARRFGLTRNEVQSIKNTLSNFLYSDQDSGESLSLRKN
jgi:hypothetical protein